MGKTLAFSQKHYVPLMKTKAAEFKSLGDLTDDVKDGITPLFEMTGQPYDYENEVPKKTIAEHLFDTLKGIGEHWEGRPLFLDFNGYHIHEIEGEPAFRVCARKWREHGLLIIPVVSPSLFVGALDEVKSVATTDGLGICVRLKTEDFDSASLEADLMVLLTNCGVSPEDTDIILDCGAVPEATIATMMMVIRYVINVFPSRDAWRSLTVAGSGFPSTLSEMSAGSNRRFLRSELMLWLSLVAGEKAALRRPAFGDYTIAHPEVAEGDPRIMPVPVALRYTLDQYWLVFKEGQLRKVGAEKFRSICQKLIAMPAEFHGAAFSWGDKYIEDSANGKVGPGNAMTWRRVGITHHITKVVRQQEALLP